MEEALGVMRYAICFLAPPLAVLLCGRPFLAAVNALLTLLGVVPGVLHALIVVAEHKRCEKR